MHFKKFQNFQTKNKLKELILAKISRIPQISFAIKSCRWIKVTIPMKKYKSSERILCKRTMFELKKSLV